MDVIYKAKEKNGQDKHPLADIFFLTEERELVLVDVTGGSDTEANKKAKRLNRFEEEKSKVQGSLSAWCGTCPSGFWTQQGNG